MNYKSILFNYTRDCFLMSLVLIIIGMYFFYSKGIYHKKKLEAKNAHIDKFIVKRILPLFFLILALFVNYFKISDYLDPRFTTAEGTINLISTGSKNPISYSLNIGNDFYSVPKKLKRPSSLTIGKKYKFVHTKGNVIVEIISID